MRQRLFYNFPWEPPHSPESPAYLSPPLLSQGKSGVTALLKSFRSPFSEQDFCYEPSAEQCRTTGSTTSLKSMPRVLTDPFVSEWHLSQPSKLMHQHLFMRSLQSCQSALPQACTLLCTHLHTDSCTAELGTSAVFTGEHLALTSPVGSM